MSRHRCRLFRRLICKASSDDDPWQFLLPLPPRRSGAIVDPTANHRVKPGIDDPVLHLIDHLRASLGPLLARLLVTNKQKTHEILGGADPQLVRAMQIVAETYRFVKISTVCGQIQRERQAKRERA